MFQPFLIQKLLPFSELYHIFQYSRGVYTVDLSQGHYNVGILFSISFLIIPNKILAFLQQMHTPCFKHHWNVYHYSKSSSLINHCYFWCNSFVWVVNILLPMCIILSLLILNGIWHIAQRCLLLLPLWTVWCHWQTWLDHWSCPML